MLFLFLAVIITALYLVSKILLPEMAKTPISKEPDNSEPFNFFKSNDPANRIEKLESLLAEKNKNIGLLQKELKIFYAKANGFEQVKVLLEEEIHRLREQNRIFRSELGLPTVQPKENSIV